MDLLLKFYNLSCHSFATNGQRVCFHVPALRKLFNFQLNIGRLCSRQKRSPSQWLPFSTMVLCKRQSQCMSNRCTCWSKCGRFRLGFRHWACRKEEWKTNFLLKDRLESVLNFGLHFYVENTFFKRSHCIEIVENLNFCLKS